VPSRGDDPPIPPAPPVGGKTESASATLVMSLPPDWAASRMTPATTV